MAGETWKKKEVRGFALYDWAKSGFETSITAGVFPGWFAALFITANGLNVEIASIEMNADNIMTLTVTFGAIIVALLSPSLGVIADRKPVKKKTLRILTNLGIFSVVVMGAAPFLPVDLKWVCLLVFYVLATCSNNLASVFYNSLLPHIGTEDEMNEISNLGFATGYVGGCVLLIIHLALLLGSGFADWAFTASMVSTGILWYGFAIFTFRWIPEPEVENPMEDLGFRESTRLAVSEVMSTLREYKNFRTLFLYIIAYFLFIDGINSIQTVGAIYFVVTLGLTTFDLILLVLALNLFAAPMAIVFSRIADRTSTQGTLQVVLVIATVVTFLGVTFAPLELEEHEDFDIQYEYLDDGGIQVSVNSGIKALVQDPADQEQIWAREYSNILPIEMDTSSPDDILRWKITQTDTDIPYIISFSDSSGNNAKISSLIEELEDSRFSISVLGGSEGDVKVTGTDHVTSLGDQALDGVAIAMRDLVWAPLGIAIGVQALILGMLFGSIQGASQGLARSLFGKMVPESRSAEFFGFFGFFGRVGNVIGPLVYTLCSIFIGSKVGILAIAFIILAGTLVLFRVDVEDGIRVAEEYEASINKA
ncbi:MAG: MFS transporter [Candidatus Thermoplasmatota archaeon]|nr:MFS transporter [Candidatus Thermoplasmatota archaeon]